MIECQRCHRVRSPKNMGSVEYMPGFRTYQLAVCSARESCKQARKKWKKTMKQDIYVINLSNLTAGQLIAWAQEIPVDYKVSLDALASLDYADVLTAVKPK